jgi:hypothetical protein
MSCAVDALARRHSVRYGREIRETAILDESTIAIIKDPLDRIPRAASP